MTANEFQTAAMRTVPAIQREYPIVVDNVCILNGVMGLAGESGECVDLVKKHLMQGHQLDKEHLASELGDVAWYLAVTAYALGYDLEQIFQMNVDKLWKRYPTGFDAVRSQHRRKDDV